MVFNFELILVDLIFFVYGIDYCLKIVVEIGNVIIVLFIIFVDDWVVWFDYDVVELC